MKRLLLPLLLSAAAQAAPFEPGRVSQDAKWWLHADLDAVRNTAIGKRLVTEIEEKKGDQLNALKLMFSVNPLTDLGGITLYGNGKKDQAVALIDGSFDREHLEGILKAADDFETENHGELTVMSWTDEEKDKRQHAAFVHDDLVAFSERKPLLIEALDVFSKNNGMVADPFVADAASQPFLIGTALLGEIELDDDESKLLGKADSLRIALAETGERMEGRMRVEVGKSSDGLLLGKVLEGIMALASLTDDRLGDADFRNSVSTADGGKTVECEMSMTSSGMITIMEQNGDFARIGE
ncbi:MAG: hypothetical protein AAGI48_05875 [Verrucomicrobiota bacterium]